MNNRDDDDMYWQTGGTTLADALSNLSTGNHDSVLLHLDTPSISPSTRPHPFASFDAFEEALHNAWKVTLSQFPETVIGQRQGLQTFIFLLQEDESGAITQARRVLDALGKTSGSNLLVWRLVLSPMVCPWDHALTLAEWAALDGPAPTDHSAVLWVEGNLASPTVRIVTSDIQQEVFGRT